MEMRHDVTTWSFLLRKAVDNVLYALSVGNPASLESLASLLSRSTFPTQNPRGWLPLYTMVTFRPDIAYATAKKKAEMQAKVVSWTSGIVGVVCVLALARQKWFR
jgi:kynurenine 3-monooxygenase